MKKQKICIYARQSSSNNQDSVSLENQMKLILETHLQKMVSERIKRGISFKKRYKSKIKS